MSIKRCMWPRHCFNKFTSFKESSLATAKPVRVWCINIQYYTHTHTHINIHTRTYTHKPYSLFSLTPFCQLWLILTSVSLPVQGWLPVTHLRGKSELFFKVAPALQTWSYWLTYPWDSSYTWEHSVHMRASQNNVFKNTKSEELY